MVKSVVKSVVKIVVKNVVKSVVKIVVKIVVKSFVNEGVKFDGCGCVFKCGGSKWKSQIIKAKSVVQSVVNEV